MSEAHGVHVAVAVAHRSRGDRLDADDQRLLLAQVDDDAARVGAVFRDDDHAEVELPELEFAPDGVVADSAFKGLPRVRAQAIWTGVPGNEEIIAGAAQRRVVAFAAADRVVAAARVDE